MSEAAKESTDVSGRASITDSYPLLPIKRSTIPNKPTVSLVTATYNRRKFFPALIQMVKNQDYPLELIEWVILDDGSDKIGDLFVGLPWVKYHALEEKINIGTKRNILNRLATHEIVVNLDDDDYYPSTRVSEAVKKLTSSKKVAGGCTTLYVYFVDTKDIYCIGPFGDNHSTNGPLAYFNTYGRSHRYVENVTQAEEASFMENYTIPMAQFDPIKTMLVLAHKENTFDKRGFREKDNPIVKRTAMKLKNFVKEKSIRDFYEGLQREI
ncbi:MAG: glycosyltransferase [Actinobacteria bacterium]|uniref:Unannotated protein n=1 Tax=freshwater metagenome TaxID=449393 RepID=A0A6J6EDU7_9ZZZZ|nr:glycosyltransferase [Actinomycetota bacterium]